MVTAIAGAGTPESAWLPYLAALALPELDLETPARVLVVAPHPDDELLAVGGLLSLLSQAGTTVDVLAVTDGEASHPGGSLSPAELARLRVRETEVALQRLGTTGSVTRLGLPDGGCGDLEAPVLQALDLASGDWLLGPWAGDGHPDHEAVGRACGRAAAATGARLLEYPVWAWHWATPEGGEIPVGRALAVTLTPQARSAKAAALQAFTSQIEPIGPLPQDAPVLPRAVLARFARPVEVVLA